MSSGNIPPNRPGRVNTGKETEFMKLKRMVASVLALLLVASILPMTALAEEPNDNLKGSTISETTQNIDTNYGNIGTVTAGTKVETNEGTITTVAEGGIVETNNFVIGREGDTVIDLNAGNFGTVNTNNGGIYVNYNQVGANAGDGEIWKNFGDVGTNDTNASVFINCGTIGENRGEVDFNSGLQSGYTNGREGEFDDSNEPIPAVIKNNSGTVKRNYGTVETNAIDGVVTNHSGVAVASHADEDAAPSEKEPVVLEGTVVNNFGTVVDETDLDNPVKYYGLSWGESVDKLNSIENFVLKGDPRNLDEIAKGIDRKGYKMKSYTAYSREEGKDVVIDNIADYEMNAPTWLKILWQKLGGKSEPKPTRTPVYTKLSGDQVKAGAFVSVNGCIFKIIEVNEDNIRVATVNQLPEKALTDMLGFLKQYLSDAQIAKFQSEPELLEEELVAKFFGGSNEHIAFYASRDLFA